MKSQCRLAVTYRNSTGRCSPEIRVNGTEMGLMGCCDDYCMEDERVSPDTT